MFDIDFFIDLDDWTDKFIQKQQIDMKNSSKTDKENFINNLKKDNDQDYENKIKKEEWQDFIYASHNKKPSKNTINPNEIKISVYDSNTISDDLQGSFTLYLTNILKNKQKSKPQWYEVFNKKQILVGKFFMEYQFYPDFLNSNYENIKDNVAAPPKKINKVIGQSQNEITVGNRK